jgi:hypothetical protein
VNSGSSSRSRMLRIFSSGRMLPTSAPHLTWKVFEQWGKSHWIAYPCFFLP